MTQPAKAQEPSMEEILASIRRIISDDEAKPAAGAAAAAPLRLLPRHEDRSSKSGNVPSGSGPRALGDDRHPAVEDRACPGLHRLLRRLPQRTARPRSTP
jgi:cell pole-organizing protein PopZ